MKKDELMNRLVKTRLQLAQARLENAKLHLLISSKVHAEDQKAARCLLQGPYYGVED